LRIEHVLFGSEDCREWRLELREALAKTRAAKRPRDAQDDALVAPQTPAVRPLPVSNTRIRVMPISEPVVDDGQQPIAPIERRTITHAFSRLLNASAVVVLAQDQEGLSSSAVVREIKRLAVERFGEKAVHLLNLGNISEEDGIAACFESLLAQLELPTADASKQNFRLRLEERLRGGEPMCLLFTRIEHCPPAALKSLCEVLRALNDQYDEKLRILMCGGEHLCDMRYANGIHSYLSHAQEELWPDPDEAEILAWASAQGCGPLEPDLVALLQELTGGHAGLIRDLLRRVKAGERSRDALTRAVLKSKTIWTAVTPLLANNDDRRFLHANVDREDLGDAPPYILHGTLRRLFWRNVIKRQQSGDDDRLVWRSPAVNEAVRRIIRSGEADAV
jgi:hypothetical protein